MITITITNGPTIDIPYIQDMNVEQAMQSAYNLGCNNTFFTYATQYYGSSLGNLVIMINETYESFPTPSSNNYSPFYYWELLINNIPASKGIDQEILKDNDTVTFELTFYSNEIHQKQSTLQAKHLYKTSSNS